MWNVFAGTLLQEQKIGLYLLMSFHYVRSCDTPRLLKHFFVFVED